MRVASLAQILSIEDGIVRLAFDLSGSKADYLLIDRPRDSTAQRGLFDGHDHYVELKGQFFGCYDGLAEFKVIAENEIELGLSYEVAGVGAKLTVVTSAPMSKDILSYLKQLSR
ncbi:hypothetical protein [Mesorhizobium sp. IMUNJ 23232]|uniref:hypothetical protein n=1 Tax=Mesorhizobium sp. IMUNJ 23232 TaxID=3376064 RepID=UPI00378E91CC